MLRGKVYVNDTNTAIIPLGRERGSPQIGFISACWAPPRYVSLEDVRQVPSGDVQLAVMCGGSYSAQNI